MKIFEFAYEEDKIWIHAETEQKAIDEYDKSLKGYVYSEFDDGYKITKVPREKWSELKIRNPEYVHPEDIKEGVPEPEDNWETMTFEEWVGGYEDGSTFTDIIAGTMFED